MVIGRVDAIQSRFLRDVGVDDIVALVEFHLTPLYTSRDIAMLGMIHKTVLGKALGQLTVFFRQDSQQPTKLVDPRAACRTPGE